MRKRNIYLLAIVIVGSILPLYLWLFSSMSVRNPLLDGPNAPLTCASNVYSMMSGYSMMGRGTSMMWGGRMMSGPFLDKRVLIDDEYYSYMGTWNMWQMHRFMWNGWNNRTHMRYYLSAPNQYSLYVQCGWESNFLPQR